MRTLEELKAMAKNVSAPTSGSSARSLDELKAMAKGVQVSGGASISEIAQQQQARTRAAAAQTAYKEYTDTIKNNMFSPALIQPQSWVEKQRAEYDAFVKSNLSSPVMIAPEGWQESMVKQQKAQADADAERIAQLQAMIPGEAAAGNAETVKAMEEELAQLMQRQTQNQYSSGRGIDTVTGSAKQYAAGVVNAVGDVAQLGGASEREEELARLNAELMNPDLSAEERAQKQARVDYLNANPGTDNEVRQPQYYEAADRLAQSGAEDIARAKEGQGKVGQALVDVTSGALQLGADVALGVLTGGGTMLPMAVRSYGSGSQEARQNGANLGQSVLAGSASALVEYLTEQISNVSLGKVITGPGGQKLTGALDDVAKNAIAKAVDRFGKTASGKAAINALLQGAASFGGEFVEEFVSSLVSPLVDRIYNDEALGQYGTLDFWKEAAYEGLTGGLVGLIAGGAEQVSEYGGNKAGYSSVESLLGGDGTLEDIENVARSNVATRQFERSTGTKVKSAVDILNTAANMSNMPPRSAATQQNTATQTVTPGTVETVAPVATTSPADSVSNGDIASEPVNAGATVEEADAEYPARQADATNAQVAKNDNDRKKDNDTKHLTPDQGWATNVMVSNIISEARKKGVSLSDFYAATADINIYNMTADDVETLVAALRPVVSALDNDIYSRYLDGILSYARSIQAEEDVRNGSLPEGTGAASAGFTGNRVSGFSRNVATDLNMEQELREEAAEAPEKYFVQTNAETLAKANAIYAQGFDAARSELERALGAAQQGAKLAPEMVPLSRMVANELTRRGDIGAARQIISSVAVELIQAGQLGQSAAIMRNADPATVLITVTKALDRINADLNVNATTEEMEALTNAIRESRDDALNILRTLHEASARESDAEKSSGSNSSARESDAEKSSGSNSSARKSNAKKSSGSNSWVQLLGDALAQNVSRRYGTSEKKATPIAQTILSDLVKFAENYALPKRAAGAKRTATARITDFFNNRENYAKAWNIARERVREKYSDNAEALDAFEEWLNGTISYNASGSDAVMLQAITESALAEELSGKNLNVRSQADAEALIEQLYTRLNQSVQATGSDAVQLHSAVERFVNERALDADDLSSIMQRDIKRKMQEIGVKMSQLIEQGAKTKKALSQKIADMLVKDYGISQNSANSVAAMAVDEFNNMVAQASEKRLAGMFKERKARGATTVKDRFQKLVNLGAFSNPQYAQLAASKVFGFKEGKWVAQLTEAEIKQIGNTDFSQDGAFEKFYDQVAQRLGREMPATLWEKAKEIRRVAMLMNPRTQVKNFSANVPMAGMRKGAERLSGAIQGAIVKRGLLSAENRTRTATVSQKSKDIAKAYYDKHKTDINGSGNKWDMNAALRDYRKFFSGTMNTDTALKAGINKVGEAVDAAREFTYNLLELGDSPFVRSAFVDSLSQYIEAQGISDEAKIPQSAIEYAKQQAMEATFKDASALAEVISRLKRIPGLGTVVEVLIPFTTTPINIARRYFEYSPFGVISAINKARSGDVTGAIDSVSRATVGSLVVALGFFLRRIGYMTGSADDDRDKRAWEQALGIQDYSFFGKYSYEWMQPVGSLLAMGADIYDAIEDDDSLYQAILEGIFAAGDAYLNTTFFQDIIDVFNGYDYSPTEALSSEVLTSGIGQFSPSIFGAFARTIDDTVRSTKTGGGTVQDILTGLQARTPFASKSLPASINSRGEETSRGGFGVRLLQQFLSPGDIAIGESEPLDDLIGDVYDKTGDKTIFPTSKAPNNALDSSGKMTALSGEEVEAYEKTLGQTYYSIGDQLLANPVFDTLSDAQQADTLSKINSYATYIANRQLEEARGVQRKESDWDDEFELFGADGDGLADYLMAKLAFSDAKSGEDTITFDELIDLWSGMSQKTQNALMGMSGFEGYKTVAENDLDLEWYNIAKNNFNQVKNERAAGETPDYDLIDELTDYWLGLTPEQKDVMTDVFGSSYSQIGKAMEAAEAGMSAEQWYTAKDKFSEIDETDQKAAQKEAAFQHWLESVGWLTPEQADLLDEQFNYGAYMAANPQKYNELQDSGLSEDKAYSVYDAVSALTPAAGESDVSKLQKYDAIMGVSGLSEQERQTALSEYAGYSEGDKDKFATAYKYNIPMQTVVAAYRWADDYKTSNGKSSLSADAAQQMAQAVTSDKTAQGILYAMFGPSNTKTRWNGYSPYTFDGWVLAG